ncbi:hypothetical protein PHABIO_91 [Pseudomonas phage Phabio]|uniref:Uncharacterized protein n=1 Tax=Pseudomonas phage Phabio TaxID=2006668 RepID=A0A1Y0STC2_9CAUD|nr:hypothetical protein MZD05_gp091 [Pseudomonas phage Phabio]ARV76722.1 hypothetical protein PHABIO_91 [Pseudomonas phage Phabio]
MDLFCYDSGYNVVHQDKFTLEDNTIPHISKHGGRISIDLHPKDKTIVFKQDGVEYAYTQVSYKVNFDMEEYAFKFHKPTSTTLTVEVGQKFALRNIVSMVLTPFDRADNENRAIMRSNGYTL